MKHNMVENKESWQKNQYSLKRNSNILEMLSDCIEIAKVTLYVQFYVFWGSGLNGFIKFEWFLKKKLKNWKIDIDLSQIYVPE